MLIHNSAQNVQETCLRWKRESKIAFVPTMGCLHEGHLALIERAKEFAERIVVSIFVNPLQFGPNEDLAKYPRPFEEDKEKLQRAGVDLLFHPSVKDLYPEGFGTRVSVGDLTTRLCGKYRPGHFDGVATVCLKLFQITQANYAIFGEKDFQQLRVIQQMAIDLNLPTAIIAHPTVRETSGLALSSRNRYLSEEERAWALTIPKTLQAVRTEAQQNGTIKVGELLSLAKSELGKTPLKLQYVEITSGRQLLPADENAYVNAVSLPHLFVAAFAGNTRLIDNISLNGDHT
jgi:pantoate--beta-alanine ligase